MLDFNILGYDKDGFDINGISMDGYGKDTFDEDGFHIFTGYNLRGYDRDGFNVNGYDKDGYDKEGYHSLTGYNRQGYDKDGYNRLGYDKDGYNKEGYNRDGYNKAGYDCDGYNRNGYDKDGYDKDGYNRQGYDVNGYDRNGQIDEKLRKTVEENQMDQKQNYLEASYFKKCVEQINGYYRDKLKEEVLKEYQPYSRTYIDRWGFIQTKWIYPDQRRAEIEVKNKVADVLKQPYFCHIDYRDDSELYIGRQAVHGWVTDWADPRASLYHQYEIYIGDKETGLNFVRDINIVKSQYCGYIDKYNKNMQIAEDISSFTDTKFKQILAANQKNKKIHDIVESIQQNQYNIIKEDKDKNILVLGCAGSGKTMILMHKIRYMKYNNPSLKMKDIIVISPTDILGRESKELSRLLQIDKVQQFTTASFYEKCLYDYFIKQNIEFEEFEVYDDGAVSSDKYENDYLDGIVSEIRQKWNLNNISKKSFADEKNKVENLKQKHISKSGKDKKFISEMHKLYQASIKTLSNCGVKDILRIINKIDSVTKEREELELVYEIIEFLLDKNCFTGKNKSSITKDEDLVGVFYATYKICLKIDYEEFVRLKYFQNLNLEGDCQVLQMMQLYMKETLDEEQFYKIIDSWRSISKAQCIDYLKTIQNRLTKFDFLEQKKEILKSLLDQHMVSERILENKNLKYDEDFNKLTELYEKTESILEAIDYTPFTYFQELEKIERKIKRLKQKASKNNGWDYLFDSMLSLLGTEFNISGKIRIPIMSAFNMVYILKKLFGKCYDDKKYVYIDEFQDFSSTELQTISDIYSSVVINLFGDVNQCINEKGISTRERIPYNLYDEIFEIKENYRNAREIATYVKRELDIDMSPYGLPGIQCRVDQMPHIKIEADDRIAIIVNDHLKFEFKDDVYHINYYTESKEILRGVYNIIPVSETKGLEFEKVIVIKSGMNFNQFYVACTRAISELYVVQDETEAFAPNTDIKAVKSIVVNDVNKLENVASTLNENEEIKNESINLLGFKLVVYTGKLKKHTGVKNTPLTHIIINKDGKWKNIPVNYLEAKKVFM